MNNNFSNSDLREAILLKIACKNICIFHVFITMKAQVPYKHMKGLVLFILSENTV